MDSRLPGGLHSLFDSRYVLINPIGVLAVVLLFFLTVNALNVFFKKGLSPSRVKATIKIALLGFLLLLLETQVKTVPPFENVLANAVNLIAMLCLANLLTYLVVDIYLFYRMEGHVPSYKRDLFAALVYIAFAMASLRFIFRLDLASILTTTTVLTAAVAFAMQTTLANIVSSFYVQNDENLRRNTWVSLPGQDITGEVVNVGFRYTTLQTLENHKVMVPNSYIMQNIVRTLGARGGTEKAATHLKVGLGYDLPPGKAIEMMSRILDGEEHIVRDPAPTVVASAFLDSSIEYDLKYYLDDYSSARVTRGNVLSRIWYAVVREGYSIPFPHREVIVKSSRVPFPVDRETVLAALRRTDILRSLGEEEFLRLSERVHDRVFGAGEVVVRQGADGESLFIVRRGVLDVHIDGVRVGNLREGDIFGEISLLTGEKRKATVTAAGEVHLVEISKADIEPAIHAKPDLLEKLSAILARREEINVERMRAAGLQQAEASGKDVFLERLKAFFGFSAD
jgi:small-conductance mechanosensitive channel